MLVASLVIVGLVACRLHGTDAPSARPRPGVEPGAVALVQIFGGRAPRPCSAITHPPSDAEAAILAQCTMEGAFGDTETLLTDVSVHITGSRPFATGDANKKDIDNKAELLTITGYAKQYACGAQSFSPGKNCTMTEMPGSPGVCWKTTYGEFRCSLVSTGAGYHPFVPPPATY